jgi:photosystem II stability/assembly factor-like uncharacterized protein
MYAGTKNKGLLISKDYGKSWEAANAGLPTATADPLTYPDIFGLAVEGNKIAMILNGVGLFISNDNGTTWKQTALAKEGYFYKISILKGNLFAAVGNAEPFVPVISTDDGMTWKKSIKGLDPGYIYSLAPCGSTMIVGGLSYLNTYSFEKNKWTKTKFVTRADQIVVNGKYVAAGQAYTFLASSDSGKTWRYINTTEIAGEYGSMGISETTVYYLRNGVLHFSTDDGKHWTGAKRGAFAVLEKSTASAFTYKTVGTQNGVTLSAAEHDGVIFKVENTNAYAIDVNIKVAFNCKSSSPLGGVSYETTEVVWRISCPANSTRSYDDSPAACQVEGCRNDTQSWNIVTWTVTN